VPEPPAAAGGDMQIPADAGEQVLSPVLVAAKDFDIEVLVMPCGAAEGQVECMSARYPPRELCGGQDLRSSGKDNGARWPSCLLIMRVPVLLSHTPPWTRSSSYTITPRDRAEHGGAYVGSS
jgi:hypothetical protein